MNGLLKMDFFFVFLKSGKMIHSNIKTIPGMTLRDYFASRADIPWDAAIQTLELNGVKEPTMNQVAETRAVMKYVEADAMIEARRG